MTDAEIREITAIAEAVASKTLALDNCAAWPEMDRLLTAAGCRGRRFTVAKEQAWWRRRALRKSNRPRSAGP
jgi:hypothetical protein